MANLFEGIANLIQGFFQSILAIVQSIFNVIYSFVHGIFTIVFDLLESFASFIGASVHFVISNIVVLGLIAVALVIYNDRNKRGTVGNNMKKKMQ